MFPQKRSPSKPKRQLNPPPPGCSDGLGFVPFFFDPRGEREEDKVQKDGEDDATLREQQSLGRGEVSTGPKKGKLFFFLKMGGIEKGFL